MEMASNYTVEVRDVDFVRQGQIAPEFLDIKFTEVFRGVGAWELKLPAEHPLLPYLKAPGSGIVVTETWDGGSRTYSGRTRARILDQDATDPEGTWTFKGADDNIIGSATVVYPDPTHEASLQEAAYWSYAGDGETVMSMAVRLNAGDLAIPARTYPWLSVPTNLHRGGSASANARFDVLGDLLQAVGAQSGLGWTFRQVLDGVIFEVNEPQDRTALIRLDIQTGGLESTQLGTSAPSATRVLVMGQGEGADRQVLPVSTPATLAEEVAWGLRWESTKDQRNTNDPTELTDAGHEILNEAGATIHALSVTPSDAPGQKLGQDWGLGDTVTVVIDGQETQAIVTQLATAIGSAGVIKQATVGDPIGYDWDAKVSSTLKSQNKRLDRLENYIDTSSGGPVTAILDPTYRGPGPAMLDFGDGVLVGPYEWRTPYKPNGSRVVNVDFARDSFGGSTPVIAGQDDAGKARITLAAGWGTYNESQATREWASPAMSQRLPSGIVSLSGLLRTSGNPGPGTLLGTLPPGHRPDRVMVFQSNQNDYAKYVSVQPNGEIYLGEGTITGGFWLSLDNIHFPAAGVATWTPFDPQGTAGSDHAFMNGWTDFLTNGGVYGRASYWKDPYGFVWFTGMVRSGLMTDNAAIATLPNSHRAYRRHHIATAAGAAGNSTSFMGVVGSDVVNSSIDYKAGTTGNLWMSLSGVTLVTADAWNNNPWQQLPLVNGWVNYAPQTSYAPFSALRRGDGLSMLHGMVGGGTIGNFISLSPEVNIPHRKILMQSVSSAARARLDLQGDIDGANGGRITPQGGNTGWYSVDSIKYMT